LYKNGGMIKIVSENAVVFDTLFKASIQQSDYFLNQKQN